MKEFQKERREDVQMKVHAVKLNEFLTTLAKRLDGNAGRHDIWTWP